MTTHSSQDTLSTEPDDQRSVTRIDGAPRCHPKPVRQRPAEDAAKFLPHNNPDAILINEAQLVLAEKRTSLAAIRTGIALVALPLSILGLLIATSEYYDVVHVLHFMLPLVALNLGLIAVGVYLIVRAIVHIRRDDRLLKRLKAKHGVIAKFLD